MYTGKVISGDCHIDIPWLPTDLFVTNAPSHLKDKMPHVKETSEGTQWFADGKQLGWVAGAALGLREGAWDPYVAGYSTRLDKMEEMSFFSDGLKGLFHPTTPELRIKDQDADRISGEVIYGILGLAGGHQGFSTEEDEPDIGGGDSPGGDYGITDREVITEVYNIYNEWLADFCKTRPERLAGLACLNAHDPNLAAKQLRRASEIGLKGAEMNVAAAVDPIYHKNWDVLWAAADETGLPISFHTVGINTRKPKKSDFEDYNWMYLGVRLTNFQLSGGEFLASIIYSGACDRFPNLKFVLGECGIGWIPYMLNRMDHEYAKQFFQLGLSLKPSEFWYRQGFSTFQEEFVTGEMVQLIGEDNIIWGSDYPHPDGVWPDSRSTIDNNLAQLSEDAVSKIVCHNTAGLYGFPG